MQIGNHAQHRPGCPFFQEAVRIIKQTRIAPESIHNKPDQQIPLPGQHDLHMADKRGIDSAPVNIAHQQNRGLSIPGHAHVDNIMTFQINLTRTAGSFQHQTVKISRKQVITPADLLPGQLLVFDVIQHLHIPHRPALDNHLAAHVGTGFEQDGVHPYLRIQPTGLGLHYLGPSHLAAVPGHIGVQGHILGLERCHPDPVLQQYPTETGNQNAFAHIGSRALEHQGRPFFLAHRCRGRNGVQGCLQGGNQAGILPVSLDRDPKIAIIQPFIVITDPKGDLFPVQQRFRKPGGTCTIFKT